MEDKITVEQFEKIAKSLPADVDLRKVAKAMGVELPVEVKPLSEQLSKIGVVKHTPKASKRVPAPQETSYVAVPSLKLDENSGTRSFWVNAKVARAVASKILEVCDENNI